MTGIPRRRSRLLLFAGALVLWGGLGFLRSCASMRSLRHDELRPSADVSLAANGRELDLARAYAPFVYHAFHPEGGRQDIPTPVDFDGNLRGDDNWEHFAAYELQPTLYYTVVETETHAFLTYHLFHPRDWSKVDLGLHLTHENDGENLQVVVNKSTERVVLLYTQAHYRGEVYAHPDANVAPRAVEIHGPLTLVDDDGRPDEHGRHAAVFVEWGGHGIYGIPDRRSPVTIDAEGRADFEGRGWVMRPAARDEEVREPPLEGGLVVPYRLEPLVAKLWPGVRSGELVGEGGILDRTVRWEGHGLTVDVPRYYEGDRFSGPFGPDRGISPFAVDFDFEEGTLGALLFDPRARWGEALELPSDDWSGPYVRNPFLPPDGPDGQGPEGAAPSASTNDGD